MINVEISCKNLRETTWKSRAKKCGFLRNFKIYVQNPLFYVNSPLHFPLPSTIYSPPIFSTFPHSLQLLLNNIGKENYEN